MTTLVARARHWLTARHLAQLGILAQMLAGFRTVGEYFRLQWEGTLTTAVANALLLGAMGAIAGAFLTVILYFFGRFRLAIALTLLTIAGLIAYRLIALPGLG